MGRPSIAPERLLKSSLLMVLYSVRSDRLFCDRHGLLVDVCITASTRFEPKAAAPILDWRRQGRRRMRTVGADKGYHSKDFVARLRRRGIAPRLAPLEGRRTPGLDGRTTRHAGYSVSQRKRKRIEEIFGWTKTVGGLRRSHLIGITKTQLAAYLVGAAYNLLRMARLHLAPGQTCPLPPLERRISHKQASTAGETARLVRKHHDQPA